MNNLSIKFPALIENVRIVESFIDNARKEFNINDNIYGNIMVAVTESVNNAIQHGNKNDNKKNVKISLSTQKNILRFVIQDEGKGFDHTNLPNPTDPENIEKPTGRGIFLMKRLSDEVIFNNGGNCVELIFYFN